MIRLRIDRSLEDGWHGLVWAEKEGSRTLMYPVIIEQTTGPYWEEAMEDAGEDSATWEPVDVVDKGVDVRSKYYIKYGGS